MRRSGEILYYLGLVGRVEQLETRHLNFTIKDKSDTLYKKKMRWDITQLLKKALKEASRLPVVDQNALAKRMLEELEAEKKWELMFAESENVLDKLADEALAEHKKGKTKPLDMLRFN